MNLIVHKIRTLSSVPVTLPTRSEVLKRVAWCWLSNALRANAPTFLVWVTTASEPPTVLVNHRMSSSPPLSFTTSLAVEQAATLPRPTSSHLSVTRFSNGTLLQALLSTTWPSMIKSFSCVSFLNNLNACVYLFCYIALLWFSSHPALLPSPSPLLAWPSTMAAFVTPSSALSPHPRISTWLVKRISCTPRNPNPNKLSVLR